MSKGIEEEIIDAYAERIEIWERWQTIDGVVYMEWKLPHEKAWHRKRTAQRMEPVILRRFFTPEEWNLKKMKLLEVPTKANQEGREK